MEGQKRAILAIYNTYLELRDAQLLDEAILISRRVLEGDPLTNPIDNVRADIMYNLSVLLDTRNGIRPNVEDEEEAFSLMRELEQALPVGHPHRASTMLNLAGRYYDRYERNQALDNLEQAIQAARQGINETDVNDTDRGDKINILAVFYSKKYKRTMDIEDFQQARRWAEDAIAATPFGHESRSTIIYNLVGILFARYELGNSSGDLDDMIGLCQDAIAGEPQNAAYHCNLAGFLVTKCKATKRLEDIEDAIRWSQAAVWVTPPDYIDRGPAMGNFATLLNLRYETLKNTEDLHLAIRYSYEAASSISDNHISRGTIFHNLAGRLHDRYKKSGDLGDLEQAVEWGRKAVLASPTDSQDHRDRMNNLAMYLATRYQAKMELADLQEAIDISQDAMTRALAEMGEQDPSRATTANNFAAFLDMRYKATNDLNDLQDVIRWYREAAAGFPIDHPDRFKSLCNLASCLCAKYEAKGTIRDLDEAILIGEKELAAIPSNHTDAPHVLYNLGLFLCSRFHRTGSMDDLQQAINWLDRALEGMPAGRPDRALALDALALALRNRYERTENQGDLQACVRRAEEAILAIPTGHFMEAKILHNAGRYLTESYEVFKSSEDLHEALDCYRRAREMSSENLHDVAAILISLGTCLATKYSTTLLLNDLQESICVIEEGILKTASDSPDLVDRYNVLGSLFEVKYARTQSLVDSEKSLNCYLDAWNCLNSSPRSRIVTAWCAVDILVKKNRLQEATLYLGEALKLLPLISPRSIDRADQERFLARFSGLSSTACSVALEAGKSASDALVLLELGRGILLGYSIDSRRDLSTSRAADEELFQKLDELRSEVETPLKADGDSFQVRNSKLRRRIEAISELDESLAAIRRLPGFERFQLAPSPNELQYMATEGPIVILNTNKLRSDAIIVRETGITVLSLPELLYSHIVDRIPATSSYDNREMKELLLWLWNVIVEPVFSELGFDQSRATEELPRIWWVAVGWTSRFPVHAAGDHSPGSTRNVLSRALFSYIPTIKALSYAREKQWVASQQTSPRVLLVTMEKTPGSSSLPGVKEERNAIVAAIGDNCDITTLDQPTVSSVTEHLGDCEIVHCACHGMTDPRDPSNSHLLVLGANGLGNSTDKLTIKEVSRISSKRSQLAYLSACRTAENPSLLLADEVISVATSFQLAGFSHVIGTMWNSKDHACVEVAKTFYKSLMLEDLSEGSHRKVAISLQKAILEARRRWPDDYLAWAPFIHLGA